jgi:hypothetical protein
MIKTFLAVSILSVLLYSCKEEDVINNPELTSTQACQDHLTAENIFSDVGRIVEAGLKDNGQNKGCPSYNMINSDTSESGILIIDFGSANCLHNGKLRSGKINIAYSGKYRDSSSVITTTFDNYHVNNNLVQGERISINKGINNKGNMWFTIEVNDASIGTSNGAINWESNLVREWINGKNTYLDISDDEYKITGSASGNGVNGNSFKMTIIDTLNVHLGCLPSCVIKSGTAKIKPNGYADRIINYVDSLCDCNIDVLINGTNYPIVNAN